MGLPGVLQGCMTTLEECISRTSGACLLTKGGFLASCAGLLFAIGLQASCAGRFLAVDAGCSSWC